jgi:hypothetical protein
MKIDFGTVEKIAQELQDIDPNELGKVFNYLRATKNIKKTRDMLTRFIGSPNFSRSKQTKRYYEAINDVFRNYKFSSAEDALYTLGWARRLMKYYK